MKHKYFELNEFLASQEAKKRGISNVPSFEVVEHLDELVEQFLDPLRAAYGMPIRVSSGYRCPELNKAVGGVPSSVHQIGYAADLVVGGSIKKFKEFVVAWATNSGAHFDQILLEKNKKGDEWIHVGLKNNLGQQRGQINIMNV